MDFTVRISEKDEAELLERAKEEVREELTEEALKKYTNDNKHVSIINMLGEYGIYNRANELDNVQVKDLTRNDKLILLLRWVGYDQLG